MEGHCGSDEEDRVGVQHLADCKSDIVSDISEHRSLDSDRRSCDVDSDINTLPQCFTVHREQGSGAASESSNSYASKGLDVRGIGPDGMEDGDANALTFTENRNINQSLSQSEGDRSSQLADLPSDMRRFDRSPSRGNPNEQNLRNSKNHWLRLLPHESRSASVFAALSDRPSNKSELPRSTQRTFGRSQAYSIDIEHHSTTYTEDMMYDQPSHLMRRGHDSVSAFDYPRGNYIDNHIGNTNVHDNVSGRYNMNEVGRFNYSSEPQTQNFPGNQTNELHHNTSVNQKVTNITADTASEVRDYHYAHDNPVTNINSNFAQSSCGDHDGDNQVDMSEEYSEASQDDDLHRASLDSKYESYSCRVDRRQKDKSSEIPLFNFDRPHMRAFHYSWWSFLVAFFMWFSITPILKEIKDSLGLSHESIWSSSISGAGGTIIFRILAGPICDSFGARWVMAVTLIISSIPVMATALIQNSFQLSLLRLITGISGSAFVTCQYWTSTMFTREVSGTANSIAAGWGNLGGGLAQIFIGSLFFPLFKYVYGGDTDLAWRTTCVIPAVPAIITAILIIRFTDDSPKGNYHKMKRLGTMQKVSTLKSLQEACKHWNTWILLIHYACCFGVEITMTNAAAIYFSEEFNQTTERAAAIASIFGWMNLFARGFGGFVSDIMNVRMGMRGRLLWQCITLIAEGLLVIGFGYADDVGRAIGFMAAFSFFVQTSEGSTFSIVPYVFQRATGSVTGLVGAGGSFGGVMFMLIVRQIGYRPAFITMGWCVICSAPLSIFLSFKGHASLLCGSDAPEVNSRQPAGASHAAPSISEDMNMPNKEDAKLIKDSQDESDLNTGERVR